jgi:EARP and GARP complex-interacting protein 1
VMETAILTMSEAGPNPADHNQEFLPLKTEVLKTIEHGSEIKTTEFHPENPRLMASVVDGKILVFNRGDAETSVMAELNSKGTPKFGGGKWSKHNSNQFLALYDCNVKSYDIRDGKCSWTIEDHAGNCLRDLDCNANKSFHIVTGGDDGSIKFWDTRNVKESVMARKDHSHWVFCVRFNTFHDEFVLSSSSDGKVLLTYAGSVSSVSSEAEENGSGVRNKKHGGLADGLLQVFDQHEDESVYCVEWSHAEPWIFASLSYDGRVIVTKVPKQYRYQILSDI